MCREEAEVLTVWNQRCWVMGRKVKEEASRRDGMKRKSCQQVLVQKHWESLSLCLGQVLGQCSWVLLIHFVTAYKNLSCDEELWAVFSLKDEGFHCHVLNPQYFSTTRDAVSEIYRELLMKDVIQDWAFFLSQKHTSSTQGHFHCWEPKLDIKPFDSLFKINFCLQKKD